METLAASETPPLTAGLAKRIIMRAERISGVKIDAARTDFLRLRLGRRLRALDLPDFESYLACLEADHTGAETRALVEALTTHTTSFFRERRQYDWLMQEGFDRLLQGRKSLTVWSAAASLGVELWSAGMLLAEREDAGAARVDWRLIGTDISTRVVGRAERSVYTEDELEGLDPERIRRFMLRTRSARDASGRPVYRIEPELRRRARFMQANLQDLSTLPPFTADVIFLRNVLIYFDPAARTRVVEAVLSRLRDGGVLLTGHAETLGPHPKLRPLRPTIYERIRA